MDLFASLLLGHLIGDFPLQTNLVFKLKKRHWCGVLLHSAIHCGVPAALIADPLRHWPLLSILGLSHFAIDWLKLRIGFRVDWVAFLVDQSAHLLVLLLLALWSAPIEVVLTPVVLYAAVAYAVMPAWLAFMWSRRTTAGFPNAETKITPRHLRLSQLTGMLLVALILVVRLVEDLSR